MSESTQPPLPIPSLDNLSKDLEKLNKEISNLSKTIEKKSFSTNSKSGGILGKNGLFGGKGGILGDLERSLTKPFFDLKRSILSPFNSIKKSISTPFTSFGKTFVSIADTFKSNKQEFSKDQFNELTQSFDEINNNLKQIYFALTGNTLQEKEDKTELMKALEKSAGGVSKASMASGISGDFGDKGGIGVGGIAAALAADKLMDRGLQRYWGNLSRIRADIASIGSRIANLTRTTRVGIAGIAGGVIAFVRTLFVGVTRIFQGRGTIRGLLRAISIGIRGTMAANAYNPVGWVLAIVISLFDFVGSFFSNWKKREGKGLADKIITSIVAGFLGVIKGLLIWPLDLVKGLLSFILGIFGLDEAKKILDSFSFVEAFEKIMDNIIKFVGIIVDVLNPIWVVIDTIINVVGSVFKTLFKVIDNFLGLIFNVIKIIVGIASFDGKMIKSGLVGAFKNLKNIVINVLMFIPNLVWEIVKGAKAFFQELDRVIHTYILDPLTKIGKYTIKVLAKIGKTILEVLILPYKILGKALISIKDFVVKLFSSVPKPIKNAFSFLLDAIMFIPKKIVNFVLGIIDLIPFVNPQKMPGLKEVAAWSGYNSEGGEEKVDKDNAVGNSGSGSDKSDKEREKEEEKKRKEEEKKRKEEEKKRKEEEKKKKFEEWVYTEDKNDNFIIRMLKEREKKKLEKEKKKEEEEKRKEEEKPKIEKIGDVFSDEVEEDKEAASRALKLKTEAGFELSAFEKTAGDKVVIGKDESGNDIVGYADPEKQAQYEKLLSDSDYASYVSIDTKERYAQGLLGNQYKSGSYEEEGYQDKKTEDILKNADRLGLEVRRDDKGNVINTSDVKAEFENRVVKDVYEGLSEIPKTEKRNQIKEQGITNYDGRVSLMQFAENDPKNYKKMEMEREAEMNRWRKDNEMLKTVNPILYGRKERERKFFLDRELKEKYAPEMVAARAAQFINSDTGEEIQFEQEKEKDLILQYQMNEDNLRIDKLFSGEKSMRELDNEMPKLIEKEATIQDSVPDDDYDVKLYREEGHEIDLRQSELEDFQPKSSSIPITNLEPMREEKTGFLDTAANLGKKIIDPLGLFFRKKEKEDMSEIPTDILEENDEPKERTITDIYQEISRRKENGEPVAEFSNDLNNFNRVEEIYKELRDSLPYPVSNMGMQRNLQLRARGLAILEFLDKQKNLKQGNITSNKSDIQQRFDSLFGTNDNPISDVLGTISPSSQSGIFLESNQRSIDEMRQSPMKPLEIKSNTTNMNQSTSNFSNVSYTPRIGPENRTTLSLQQTW